MMQVAALCFILFVKSKANFKPTQRRAVYSNVQKLEPWPMERRTLSTGTNDFVCKK